MKGYSCIAGLVLLLFFNIVNAQSFQWRYVEDFKPAYNPHGIVIDPQGRIWVGNYSASDTLIAANGNIVPVSAINVYNSDGSEVGFSPITVLSVNGVDDTLNSDRQCRGVSLDYNGNILYTTDEGVYRINYLTGNANAKLQGNVGIYYAEAAADSNGFIYVAGLVPNQMPIAIYDSNFQFYNNAITNNSVISRSLAVNGNGKDLYQGAIFPANGILHYHSEDGPDGQYTLLDTLLGPNPDWELWGQCIDWDPAGRIWIGSYWDTSPNAYRGWYAFDPTKPTSRNFVDSLGQNMRNDPNNGSPDGSIPPGEFFWDPHGVAFREESDGSWTAYTADFSGNVVKKWTNPYPLETTLSKEFVAEWNLASLPMNIRDSSVTTLFPNSVPKSVYGFEGSYQSVSTVTESKGYWIYYNDAIAETVSGTPLDSIWIYLTSGWNLIGGVSCDVAVANIEDPDGIIQENIFGYNDTYFVTDSIKQGEGYWVYAQTDGIVKIRCETSQHTVPTKRVNKKELLTGHQISLQDFSGAGQTLYFDVEYDSQESGANNSRNSFYKLPPLPPLPAFDARFSTGCLVEAADEATILIQATKYPLKISVANNSTEESINYILEEMIGNMVVAEYKLREGTVVEITNSQINRLKISKSISEPSSLLPKTFWVHPNYPNPFNPSTTIKYDLPVKSNVTIVIYNSLGQKVRTLINEHKEPGFHEIIWDSTNDRGKKVGSGIYLYRITTEENNVMRKMILMK